MPSPHRTHPNANLQQVEHEEAKEQQRELPGAQPDVRAEHDRRHRQAQHQLAHVAVVHRPEAGDEGGGDSSR